jgi:hypothetical protein
MSLIQGGGRRRYLCLSLEVVQILDIGERAFTRVRDHCGSNDEVDHIVTWK